MLARLPELLEQLERAFTAAGGTVHWARDANEANRIVTELVQATGADEVVKVKSMATQEIGLNEALEAAGIAAWETDLAELIVQLGHDQPVPHPRAGDPPQPRGDPRDLPARDGRGRPARRPRPHRRPAARSPRPPGCTCGEKFLQARVAISGANFAVAETGTLSVVESEGNGRMCLTLPRDADHGHGHREAGADLARPRGVPAAAAPVLAPASG